MITNILKASMIEEVPSPSEKRKKKKDKTLQLERTIGCFSSESSYVWKWSQYKRQMNFIPIKYNYTILIW